MIPKTLNHRSLRHHMNASVHLSDPDMNYGASLNANSSSASLLNTNTYRKRLQNASWGRVCMTESQRLCRSVNECVLPFNLLSRSQQLIKPFSNHTETHETVRSSVERTRS